VLPAVTRPGNLAGHSLQCTAVVKNTWSKNSWSYTYTSPNAFMLWCLIKHRDNFTLVGFQILQALDVKSSVFCDITPCSLLKIIRRFGGIYLIDLQVLLATCLRLLSCLAYSSTLKMEATCSSETSVDFLQKTRRYIPENRILQRSPPQKRCTTADVPVCGNSCCSPGDLSLSQIKPIHILTPRFLNVTLVSLSSSSLAFSIGFSP
jgi:hypothetical protein